MGIKYDEKTKTWTAYFSKRHPITKMPKSYKSIGLRSKAQAQKVERDLIVKLNSYFQNKIVPTWSKVVEEYFEMKGLSDWSLKTLQDAQLSLQTHTTEKWGKRKVDSKVQTGSLSPHLFNLVPLNRNRK